MSNANFLSFILDDFSSMWVEEMTEDNNDVAEEVGENQLPATLADCFKHSYEAHVSRRHSSGFVSHSQTTKSGRSTPVPAKYYAF